MGAQDAMSVFDEVLRRRCELRECRYRGSGQNQTNPATTKKKTLLEKPAAMFVPQ